MKKNDKNWATYAVIVEVRARRVVFSDKRLRMSVNNVRDVIESEIAVHTGPGNAERVYVHHLKNWHRTEP